MTWICPSCRREFQKINQWHSCVVIDVEAHLLGKPESIKKCFYNLIDFVSSFGDIHVSAVKSAIQVRAKSTFLSIKVKRTSIEIEFQLTREHKEFPIIKTARISKKGFLHTLVIESEKDFNRQIKAWLSEAYKLDFT